MKIFLLLISFTLLTSCSNLSKNFVKTGEFELRSGKANDKEWDDDLLFKRFSWYKELTLVFDLLIVKVDENSPYYNWFSEGEKKAMKKCKQSYVAVSYFQDGRRISVKDMYNQFEALSHSRFAMPGFRANLKMHPDYEILRLQLYKVDGFCQESFQDNPLKLAFPGFNSVEITPL